MQDSLATSDGRTIYDESLLAFVFRLEGGDEAGVVSGEIRGGSPDGQGAVAAVRVIAHHVAQIQPTSQHAQSLVGRSREIL